MCGRYSLSRRKQIIEEYFDASGNDDWSPRYNIAPTRQLRTPEEIRAWLDSLAQFSDKIPSVPETVSREWLYQDYD